MNNNFNLLEFAGLSEVQPWELEQSTPTDLRAVIDGNQLDMEEVGKQIASFVGDSIEVEEIESPDGDIAWTMRVSVTDLPTDMIIWVEPLNDATRESSGVNKGCVLAIQTILHKGDPLTHFSNLMRLLGGIDISLHSVCDLPTGRWFSKEIIDTVFVHDDIEPPEEVLWITRLVEAPKGGDPEDRWAWISTHGLSRCGRVELEMLGVPAILSSEAVHLVDGLAALTLETPLPPAAQEVSLGSELRVSLMESNRAISLLTEEMPGKEGRKVPVVVISHHDGISICPLDALHVLQSANSAILKTSRSSSRQAMIAQSQWKLFIKAVKHIGESEHAACLAQVAWSNAEDEDSPREYLWFRITGVAGETLTGELAHKPTLVTSLDEGHREEITQGEISDWVLMTPVGPMGPSDAESIELFLDQFNN